MAHDTIGYDTPIGDPVDAIRLLSGIDEPHVLKYVNKDYVSNLGDEQVLQLYALFTATDNVEDASKLVRILREQNRSLREIGTRLQAQNGS